MNIATKRAAPTEKTEYQQKKRQQAIFSCFANFREFIKKHSTLKIIFRRPIQTKSIRENAKGRVQRFFSHETE
jgi:hypothetical protein